jgi:hypothetical protein
MYNYPQHTMNKESNLVYAVVPGLATFFLWAGIGLALYIDRRDLLRKTVTPKPVYVRYTSQATAHLNKRPHWIFLVSMVFFEPLLFVTVVWQSTLARQMATAEAAAIATPNEPQEPDLTLVYDIEFFGFATGCAAVLVAAIPMGHGWTGTILHSLVAGAFGVAGIGYGWFTQELAYARGNDALAILRTCTWVVACLGAVWCLGTLFPALRATHRLARHQKADTMTPEEVTRARQWEAALAAGQGVVLLGIGFLILTAAPEVVTVQETNDVAWFMGVVGAGAAGIVLGLAMVHNECFYWFCQIKRKEVAPVPQRSWYQNENMDIVPNV